MERVIDPTEIAEAFERLRHAIHINHHILCRCHHRRLLHQFDEAHMGTCTIKGCACVVFEPGLAGVA